MPPKLKENKGVNTMSENETRPISQTAGYNIDKDPKEMTSIVKLKKSTTSTIEVGTVTTLPAGEDATVTNSGDEVNAIFNFGIPQGAKGDKGDKGDTGEQGATGETGATGATGATPNISMTATVDGQTGTPSVVVTKSGTAENPNFNMSFSGLKGAKGDKGDTGDTGATGATGATPNISATASVNNTTGTPAVVVTRSGSAAAPNIDFSFSGLKGEQGAQGIQGEKGEKGDKGDAGSAGNITATASVDATTGTPAVVVTKSGTNENPNFDFSFSGLKGAKGDTGETGATGAQGETGATPNISATASVDNTTGTPAVVVTKSGSVDAPNLNFSFTGLKGETGAQGAQGIQGEQGAQGIQGETGATGATPNVSATASVDATTGTPAVTVTKSGTAENPSFDFAFTGLKGESGGGGGSIKMAQDRIAAANITYSHTSGQGLYRYRVNDTTPNNPTYFPNVINAIKNASKIIAFAFVSDNENNEYVSLVNLAKLNDRFEVDRNKTSGVDLSTFNFMFSTAKQRQGNTSAMALASFTGVYIQFIKTASVIQFTTDFYCENTELTGQQTSDFIVRVYYEE